MLTAKEKFQIVTQKGLHVCVGLDTDITKIPKHLQHNETPLFTFNKNIIDATYLNTASYKLNFAFYEAHGIAGLEQLRMTVDYIKSLSEEVLIIGDAKRGDIGNTSEMYAEAVFNAFGCDAVTINPYMGVDSVLPFTKYENNMVFILVLTSNSGSYDFQRIKDENGNPLYLSVLDKVKEWNQGKNCGIVFGGTHINELTQTIDRFEDLPVLIPGVGAQGGSAEEISGIFKTHKNANYLVNSSRGIIYKDNSENFAAVAAKELALLNLQL